MNDESAFSAADRRLADLARALSHPARLASLRVLAARQACVCGEIVEVMPLAAFVFGVAFGGVSTAVALRRFIRRVSLH